MIIDDTIVAIATAVGPAGIGVIRLSGSDSISIVEPLFKSKRQPFSLKEAESHKLYYGWIQEDETPLDEVLVVLMRAPHSYTTENIIEIQCHGSMTVLQQIIQSCLKRGARLAEPGEFTQRAFYHGRLDLTQAEAVADLIHADSTLGMKVAVDQLSGKLYQEIDAIKEKVLYVTALVEASIDFPEEDTLFTHYEDCHDRLSNAQVQLKQLLASAEKGKLLRNGIGVALVGQPNVGKSSLLNALLREQRAIVTHVPGTTRDLIEETVSIQGVAIRLIDTAGIRQTTDVVEHEGIQRSQAAQRQADLTLFVVDGEKGFCSEDRKLLDKLDPQHTIVVFNKQDLCQSAISGKQEQALQEFVSVGISAKYQQGLDALEQQMVEHLLGKEVQVQEQAMITNIRQQEAAQRALEALEESIHDLEAKVGEECLVVHLYSALHALGEVVGETTADDLLNRIFSEFCIGK